MPTIIISGAKNNPGEGELHSSWSRAVLMEPTQLMEDTKPGCSWCSHLQSTQNDTKHAFVTPVLCLTGSSHEISVLYLSHGLSHLPASTELEAINRTAFGATFLASAVPTGFGGALHSPFPEHGLKGCTFDYPGSSKTHRSKHIFSVDLANTFHCILLVCSVGVCSTNDDQKQGSDHHPCLGVCEKRCPERPVPVDTASRRGLKCVCAYRFILSTTLSFVLPGYLDIPQLASSCG